MITIGDWKFQLCTLMLGFAFVGFQRGMPGMKLAFCAALGIVGGLFSFIPGKHERIYVFDEHLRMYPYMVFLLATVSIIVDDKEQFYGRRTEGDIYVMALSFLYMVTPWQLIHKCLFAFGAIPVAAICICAWANLRLKPKLRMTLSLLVSALMILICGAPVIHVITDSEFASIRSVNGLQALESLLEGAMSAVCGLYLIGAVLPFLDLTRGRHETKEHYDRRLEEEEIPFIQDRILTTQIPIAVLMFITLVHGLPLALNWYFNWLPYDFLLAYALALSPMLTFRLANQLFKQPERSNDDPLAKAG